MHLHASCAAREGDGVLLMGPPGIGKSDLLLRLLDHGFDLVADDQVQVDGTTASPPRALAGLLEVRGLGIVRLAHVSPVRLALAVDLGTPAERLPPAGVEGPLGLPVVRLDGRAASAVQRVALALDCALGRVRQVAGAFTQ